jgi:hypothetical protein
LARHIAATRVVRATDRWTEPYEEFAIELEQIIGAE